MNNLQQLNDQELREINGGGIAGGIGLAILGMAIYEHGKHFIAGMFNPFGAN